jgi:hypothetical protein
MLRRFDEVLALANRLNNPVAEVSVSLGAGFCALSAGEYDIARRYVERGLASARQIQEHTYTPALRRALGYVLLHNGDPLAASEQFAASLRENRALKDMGGVVRCLSAFAALAGARGDMLRAARLTGACESQFRATGTNATPNDRREYRFHMSAILAQLPDSAFEAARAEGAAMSLEQAIAYALENDHA